MVFAASTKAISTSWMKALTAAVVSIREELVSTTCKGWLKYTLQPGTDTRASALALEEGFAVLDQRKISVFTMPPSHFSGLQSTPRRIFELHKDHAIKQFTQTSSHLFVFSLERGGEKLLFAAGSEISRQLWVNACELEIIHMAHPTFSVKAAHLLQWLRTVDLEDCIDGLVEEGLGSMEALTAISNKELSKFIKKYKLDVDQGVQLEEAVYQLKPFVEQPRFSKSTVASVKQHPSVKQAMITSSRRFPLSLRLTQRATTKPTKPVLYAWGTAHHLGIDSHKSEDNLVLIPEPTKVKRMRGRNSPDAIFAGDGYFACLTQKGQLFTWGEGCLGVSERLIEFKATPFAVRTLLKTKVTYASCGKEHMACVSDAGEVYIWGRGAQGQLGLGEHRCEVSQPLPLPGIGNLPQDPVVSVSCGVRHTLVVTNRGYVFAMGEAAHGKLGLETAENVFQPEWVQSLSISVIAQIAAGESFSCAVSLKGEAYIWGRVVSSGEDIPVPTVLPQLDNEFIRHVCTNGGVLGFIVGSFTDLTSTSVYTLGEMPTPKGNLLLGHESTEPELLPRRVDNLQGYHVMDLSIGATHCGKSAPFLPGILCHSSGTV